MDKAEYIAFLQERVEKDADPMVRSSALNCLQGFFVENPFGYAMPHDEEGVSVQELKEEILSLKEEVEKHSEILNVLKGD